VSAWATDPTAAIRTMKNAWRSLIYADRHTLQKQGLQAPLGPDTLHTWWLERFEMEVTAALQRALDTANLADHIRKAARGLLQRLPRVFGAAQDMQESGSPPRDVFNLIAQAFVAEFTTVDIATLMAELQSFQTEAGVSFRDYIN
jgi:hypothetical protein